MAERIKTDDLREDSFGSFTELMAAVLDTFDMPIDRPEMKRRIIMMTRIGSAMDKSAQDVIAFMIKVIMQIKGMAEAAGNTDIVSYIEKQLQTFE